MFSIFFSDNCLHHSGDKDHPERPARLAKILENIEIWKQNKNVSMQNLGACRISQLLDVHCSDYLHRLEASTFAGKSSFMCPDNYLCIDSLDAILSAANCAIHLAESLLKGNSSFAAIRPPGHHAFKNKAEGFCFVNNAAVAAELIKASHPNAKILITDFDVHHGNGVEDIFKARSDVFYYSIHASSKAVYPYSGQESYTGEGQGKGFTKNIEMPMDCKGDIWFAAFKDSYIKISEEFKPDFQLICAGFDAHTEDPFGLMEVEDEHYEKCFQLIKESAKKYSSDRCGFLLEGGYNPFVLQRLTNSLVNTFTA